METGYFRTDQHNLFYRYWPAYPRKSTIVCLHGLAGDSRTFNYLGNKMSSLGHDIYAVDLPGYGLSHGEKGDVAFDTTMMCLDQVIDQVNNRHPNERCFLLGFSLGGLHALWYANLSQEKLEGLTLMAPHLRIQGAERHPRSEPSPEVLKMALQKFSETPEEKVNIGLAVPNAFGKLGGEEWSFMMEDSICNFNYSYRYIFDVLINCAENVENLYSTKVPMLLLHGDQDWITVPEQSKAYLSKCLSREKELRIIEGSDHWFYDSVFYYQKNYSEEQRQMVIRSIDAWVEKRLVQTRYRTKIQH